MVIILAAIAAAFGIGWLKDAVGIRALLLYMHGKGYTPPTNEELRACCDAAARRMFGLKP